MEKCKKAKRELLVISKFPYSMEKWNVLLGKNIAWELGMLWD
jgi:hypothetical protein